MIVIEHPDEPGLPLRSSNLDVINPADWVIDLGPGSELPLSLRSERRGSLLAGCGDGLAGTLWP